MIARSDGTTGRSVVSDAQRGPVAPERREVDLRRAVEQALRHRLADRRRELEAVPRAGADDQHRLVIAMRVPVPTGSVVDLTVLLTKTATVESVNSAIRAAAEGPLAGILKYTEDPIVSSDVIGDPHSSIFAPDLTQILNGNFLKVVSWYDNEWGYSCRTADLIKRVAAL